MPRPAIIRHTSRCHVRCSATITEFRIPSVHSQCVTRTFPPMTTSVQVRPEPPMRVKYEKGRMPPRPSPVPAAPPGPPTFRALRGVLQGPQGATPDLTANQVPTVAPRVPAAAQVHQQAGHPATAPAHPPDPAAARAGLPPARQARHPRLL